VAATLKVAFCPAIAVWLIGCTVIEGMAVAGLFPAEVSPAHPVFKMASAKTNEGKRKRFMIPPALSPRLRRRVACQREEE